MEARSVPLLASKFNLNYLASFELAVNDENLTMNPLPEICSLVTLQKLSISYDDDEGRESPANDMLPLKNLKRLRKLETARARTVAQLIAEHAPKLRFCEFFWSNRKNHNLKRP